MAKAQVSLRSALVGSLALGTLALLVSSWAITSPAPDLRSFQVQLAPHPRDHVRIIEGSPYVVPAGKILTLKAVSATGEQPSDVTLEIDGQSVAVLRTFGVVFGGGGGPGVAEIPFGLSARAGETVTMTSIFGPNPDQAVAFGFLSED